MACFKNSEFIKKRKKKKKAHVSDEQTTILWDSGIKKKKEVQLLVGLQPATCIEQVQNAFKYKHNVIFRMGRLTVDWVFKLS